MHFFKDGPSEKNGVLRRWRHLITTSGIISNLGLHVSEKLLTVEPARATG